MSQVEVKRGELPGFSGGKCEYVKIGPVICKKYSGKFSVPGLQDKADTGMWYTLVQGNPHAIQGEGSAPEYAIRDAMSRCEDMVKNLQYGRSALIKALGNLEKEGSNAKT